MKLLDKGTYGNSPACEVLVDKINQYNINPSRIGKILSVFNKTLRELEKIDRQVCLGLASMTYKHYQTICETFPDEVKTYVKNVLSMRYNIWLTKMKAQKGKTWLPSASTK